MIYAAPPGLKYFINAVPTTNVVGYCYDAPPGLKFLSPLCACSYPPT